MVRGGCLPVRGSDRMTWMYEIPPIFWSYPKMKHLDVIKGYFVI